MQKISANSFLLTPSQSTQEELVIAPHLASLSSVASLPKQTIHWITAHLGTLCLNQTIEFQLPGFLTVLREVMFIKIQLEYHF